MKKLTPVLSILFSFALGACGSTNETSLGAKEIRANTSALELRVPLQIGSTEKLGAAGRKLAIKIQKEESITYDELKLAFLEQQAQIFNEMEAKRVGDSGMVLKGFKSKMTSARKLNHRVGNLVDELDPNDPFEFKVQYEEKMVKEPFYNKDHRTIAHIFNHHLLQCYSGAALYTVALKSLKEASSSVPQENLVLIYEPGHMLPGFMEETEVGWKLYGIETTADGRAKVNYGLAKDLRGAIRVVDASLWLLVESFKNVIENPEEVLQASLEQTADRYGIDLDLFRYGDLHVTELSNATLISLNDSIFAFGEMTVSKGSRERQSFEEANHEEVKTLRNGKTVPKRRLFLDRKTAEVSKEAMEQERAQLDLWKQKIDVILNREDLSTEEKSKKVSDRIQKNLLLLLSSPVLTSAGESLLSALERRARLLSEVGYQAEKSIEEIELNLARRLSTILQVRIREGAEPQPILDFYLKTLVETYSLEVDPVPLSGD